MAKELTAARVEVAAMRERCALLEAVVELIPDAVYVKDAHGRYVMINTAGARLIGKAVEQVIGTNDADLFSPDTAREFIEGDRAIIAGGAAKTGEDVGTAAGVTRSYVTTKGPLHDDRGRVVGVIGISRDITDSKRLESERDRLLARLRLQIDRLPLGYIYTDAEGRIVDWNPAAEKLFGYTREEALGRMRLDLIVPQPIEEGVRNVVERIRAGDMNVHTISQNRAKDGRIMTCEWFNTPIIDDNGQFMGAIFLAQDVTTQRRTEERLKRSESLLTQAQQVAHIGSWSWEIPTNAMVWSEEHYRIFGLPEQAFPLTFERFLSLVHPDDRETVRSKMEAAIREHQPYECCMRALHSDGSVRVVQSRGRVVYDEVGAPARMFGTVQDITEATRAQEALETSRRRFQAVFENSLDAIALVDGSGRYMDCNPAICRLLGYSREHLLKLSWWDTTPVLGRARIPELLDGLLAVGTQSGECTVLCNGGAIRDVEYRSVAHILPGLHLAVYRDITERKHSEAALSEYAARLQVLSRRVVDVQEEERRHIARELHDEIGQTLTAIGINLQAIMNSNDAEAGPRIAECVDMIDHAIQQVRHLSLDLRPSMLDDLGLVATLRWYTDRQAQRVGYQARFLAEPEEVSIEPGIAISVFRIAQEALTNVARHAGATRVWVTLRVAGGVLALTVRDDGSGFVPESSLEGNETRRAFGLLGMRERATLLGGRVTLRSAPDLGTTVLLTLPLRQGEKRA